MKLKAIIIDDEKPARDIVAAYASERSDIEIVGECQNGFEAIKMIQEIKPDLIFLDIQMPKIDGFELLEVLEYRPAVIFCTAYDHYAVQAFEKSAVDYLMKPFSRERFNEAILKVAQSIGNKDLERIKVLESVESVKESGDEKLTRVVARQGSKLHVVQVAEISHIESEDDYVRGCSEKGDFLKEKTMQYFEKMLPADMFIRIHRSYIVNINCIDKVELYEKDTHLVLLKNGAKLRASREGYKRLRAIL
ncbi:MAG: DNA-binding response regulator [Bacteroidetes bacterium HGW-Bacteroidetes-6]|nr:MAG: DNA-binding response regulator [Bacteroidetes bacterium HGW-Bacteroidetes-6]